MPTASVSKQKAVVAVDRVDHVQLATTRQQLGQFLLQPQRVQPVRRDAADHHGDGAAAQRRLHAAAAAAHVMAGKRFGQRHICACIEARQQFAALMLQIALHRVAAAGRRVLVALGIVGEPVVQFDLAPIRQMREAPRDLHADVRRTTGAVVVTVAPVGVGLDRRDLRALGADLIGGGACPDRQHQRRTHRCRDG